MFGFVIFFCYLSKVFCVWFSWLICGGLLFIVFFKCLNLILSVCCFDLYGLRNLLLLVSKKLCKLVFMFMVCVIIFFVLVSIIFVWLI